MFGGARTSKIGANCSTILTATWVLATPGLAEPQLPPLALRPSVATAETGGTISRGELRSARLGQVLQLAQAKIGDTEELRQALVQEQQKVQALTRDLRTSRQDLDSVLGLLKHAREQWINIAAAAENETEKLQKSLQEERARGQRLEQDLVTARHDIELQAALTSGTSDRKDEPKQTTERELSELQTVAQQEKDRASRLEQDLAVARRELETRSALIARDAENNSAREAAEKALAELQTKFQQEHDRAKQLEENLATARSDLENRSSQIATANEQTAEIKLTAENAAAKLKLSLNEEHQKAEGLAQELSLARTQLFAYEAQAAASDDGAKELQELLRQERSRSSQIGQELATARQALEPTPAVDKRCEQAAEWQLPWVGLLGSSQGPFDRSLHELAAPLREPKAPSPGLGVVTAGKIDRAPFIEAKRVDSVQPAVGPGDTRPEQKYPAEVARLTARATGLLGQGDIGAARAVLERAAELGSAQADFALAETYDPNVLAKWGAYGTRGDAVKARELYIRAKAGGVLEAKERFDALGR
jgi:hypothetical protein